MKYALISVSDKTGIAPFAYSLIQLGFTILSTGGTAKILRDAGVKVTDVSDFTGFPEILDGRVKTLHPLVHAGILNIRNNEEHQKVCREIGINNIDLVAVNLYPFEETVMKNLSEEGEAFDEIIENIDIGGPALLRSAAKNHLFITVITDAADYEKVISEIKSSGDTALETRKMLAAKAFSHTALYDSVISGWFNRIQNIAFPYEYTIGGRLASAMRYGENPHQAAAFYKIPLMTETGVASAEKLHGKELSYNNIADIHASIELAKEFEEPVCIIVKHMNPCGAAAAEDIEKAFDFALAADPLSAFGGIVTLNREVTATLAEKLSAIFLEVIIAPSYTPEALAILKNKKNVRVMRIDFNNRYTGEQDLKKVTGGFLVQDRDLHRFNSLDGLSVPTKRSPTSEERKSLSFAWIVAKHVKSNAIVYVSGTRTVGIGAGQMSRVDSAKIGAIKAQSPISGCVMASDAFFPFRDSVDEAAERGITSIISPGGSVRDDEVIAAADSAGIAMIFTGVRHFRH
ncbi:MAG: bifunctional phosphoribosylaminoimidazolecarboxamide formyltransferase/IMP cyclohydrolase [Deferribacteraceae bacterium]|jgi:phosphoribosylaminoimidazolecarboxamide formyltransferase/IMP cyclohydrolase|nr:bifunctional phosphoribosylaminoimidazolecarboxamide formyltransferase/IMP cyclohydrolase [Deferribacteraceae bacterium]